MGKYIIPYAHNLSNMFLKFLHYVNISSFIPRICVIFPCFFGPKIAIDKSDRSKPK